MDFEKLGRTIFEAITGKKEEGQGDSTTAEVDQDPAVEDPKTEYKKESGSAEVDTRDARIKELEQLLLSKDAIILERDGQIKALKELTSVDNPVNDELSLEEIIQRGEF